jgi:hypothetical protein
MPTRKARTGRRPPVKETHWFIDPLTASDDDQMRYDRMVRSGFLRYEGMLHGRQMYAVCGDESMLAAEQEGDD